jgi:hypothetical protein
MRGGTTINNITDIKLVVFLTTLHCIFTLHTRRGCPKLRSPVNVVAMSYVSLTYFIYDRQLPNLMHVLSPIETPIVIGAIWRHCC